MRWVTALAAGAITLSCAHVGGTGGDALPTPVCPMVPTNILDLGPEAQQAAKQSIGIALSQTYMREKIKSQMEVTLPATATRQQLQIPDGSPGAIPSGGVDMDSVRLEQRVDAGARVNLLTLDVTPWLRSDQADPSNTNTVHLKKTILTTRPFRLSLRLVPHLVTPSTVADLSKRRVILGCTATDQTCSGAVLAFAFDQLYDKGFSEKVFCDASGRSANYDIISAQVLQGVLNTLAHQPPLALPTTNLLDMINLITGAKANLVGMAVGSDLDLKIGLLLDSGSPTPFDPEATFRNTSEDWALSLDPTFVAAKIDQTVADTGASNTPPLAVNRPVSVTFRQGGLDVSATGTATTTTFSCNVPVTMTLGIEINACLKNGTRVLRMCPGTPNTNVSATPCLVFEQLFGIFKSPRGFATATVGCATCTCMDTPLEISLTPGDTLYLTHVDTDGIFELSGRSTFLDPLLPGRSPAPAACP